MEYIKEGYTLPVPFNLIPTPLAISYTFKNLWKRIEEKKSKLIKTNSISTNQIDEPSIELKAPTSDLPPSMYKSNALKEKKVIF
jgi:hypothetical protein